MRQGCCVLPPDDQGRVCDRLAGLEQVIDLETIRQVLQETGRLNPRACKLPHEVVLWVVLAMGIFTNVSIRQVFKQTRFARAGEDSPCRSSLCHARQRLGVAPVRRLFLRTVRPLATPATPGAFYKGMRLMGIDGDEQRHPAAKLIPLYHERWEEELVFDEQKTHQDPQRASKPANLRSETPAGVIPELYALSLAHFVVRAMMFEAATSKTLDPDRLSFTGCFHILQCRLPECHPASLASLSSWYEALLWEMSRECVEPRRNRINPRVIKQKMSNWKKKRPEHCHPPPLQKTFAESVVMTN